MLVVRYHAEKYPVARNNTPANRAKNRRTTVRLSRVFTPQVEPEIENTLESDSAMPEADPAPSPAAAEEESVVATAPPRELAPGVEIIE